MAAPRVVVLGGINGAGKTTASNHILVKVFQISKFVNADRIARGLNGINPEAEAFRAGRIMLDELNDLASRRVDFAFESTLAGKAYAAWLNSLRSAGYEVYLFYYWLNSPELAISRIANRVAAGGHFVPDQTVRLRYQRSVRNFFELYQPVCDWWEVYDNSYGERELIAIGSTDDILIGNQDLWEQFQRSGGYA